VSTNEARCEPVASGGQKIREQGLEDLPLTHKCGVGSMQPALYAPRVPRPAPPTRLDRERDA